MLRRLSFAPLCALTLLAVPACSALVNPDESRFFGEGEDSGTVVPRADLGFTPGVDSGPPPIELDAGEPPIEVDAGEPPVEVDSGPPPRVDSGTPPVNCGFGETNCSGRCVNVRGNDLANCGGCGRFCIGSCLAGFCQGTIAMMGNCPSPLVSLNGQCFDLLADPNNCGRQGNVCASSEQCSNGRCECRPGLSRSQIPGNQGCYDPRTNPRACGTPPVLMQCQSNARFCVGGRCTAVCQPPQTVCDGTCVNTDRDPLNCGGCGNRCDSDELCFGGDCQAFESASQCSSCPCDACTGDVPQCCKYPSSQRTICVNADTCPPPG